MKTCFMCKRTKSLTEFGASGSRSECKKCGVILAKEHRESVRLGWQLGLYTRPEFKKCEKCRQILPASDFGETDLFVSGLYAYCKICSKKHFFNYRRNKQTNYLFSRTKARAKKNGIDFSITIDDIIIPFACPVLGIELSVSNGNASDNSPSIDRIYNNVGYVAENIIIVSNLVNRIKSNATIDQLIAIAEFYRAIQNRATE
jgi:RNase P subunit RPR2